MKNIKGRVPRMKNPPPPPEARTVGNYNSRAKGMKQGDFRIKQCGNVFIIQRKKQIKHLRWVIKEKWVDVNIHGNYFPKHSLHGRKRAAFNSLETAYKFIDQLCEKPIEPIYHY